MPRCRKARIICRHAVVTLLAFVPAAYAADALVPPATQVSLRFDWGSEFHPRVMRSVTRSRAEQATNSSSLVLTNTLNATRQPSGHYVIQADEPAFHQVNGMPMRGKATLAVLAAGLVDPPFEVSGDGAFVGLDHPEQVRAEFDAQIQRLSVSAREAAGHEAILAAIQKVVALDALEAQVREPWEAFVGGWAGRSFAIGETRETYGEDRPALLGRLPVKTVSRWTAAGPVACRAPPSDSKPAKGPLACVRLERRTFYEPESLRQVLGALHARLAPNGAPLPDGVIRTLTVETTSFVISEPSTLKPHYGELRKVTSATAMNAGVEQTLVQDDLTRYTWMK